jgi:prepilin-type N-terminal cleavage/methylation domain-containing protein
MSRRRFRPSDDGFTLPELLVAITILGIIIVAIGAMITTSFRTSSIVSAELQGSRGPKVVSRYWVPDVEQAKTFDAAAPCGTGTTAVATFGSDVSPSAFDDRTAVTPTQTRTITWWEVAGPRDQLVRWVCDPDAQPRRIVVVSDLKGLPTATAADRGQVTITVRVPDRSRPNDVYEFDVTAQSQVTTPTSAP